GVVAEATVRGVAGRIGLASPGVGNGLGRAGHVVPHHAHGVAAVGQRAEVVVATDAYGRAVDRIDVAVSAASVGTHLNIGTVQGQAGEFHPIDAGTGPCGCDGAARGAVGIRGAGRVAGGGSAVRPGEGHRLGRTGSLVEGHAHHVRTVHGIPSGV